MYRLHMAAAKKITLCWYCNTANGWRYFPALLEKGQGDTIQARHGFVMDKGQLKEYRNGRYVLRSYVDGKKAYQKVDSNNPVIAVAILHSAQRAALKAARNPATAKSSLALLKNASLAYIADCQARRAMEAAAQARLVLDEFVPMCSVIYVRGITREDVLTFHAALRKRGCTDRTVANKHDRLKAFLRFCKVDTAFMPGTPKYEKRLPTTYTSAETTKILAVADGYMKLVLGLGLKLGLREQEITYAEWGDVNWDESVFRVQGKAHWKWKIKDAEMREIPVPADLLSDLRTWREKHPKSRLIVGTSTDRPNQHFLRALKRLARREGLNCGKCAGCSSELKECSHWTLHKLRRTYGTRLLKSEVDVRTLQDWMGHADLASTLRYLRPTAAKDAQDKINAVVW
jgi:integrase